MRNILVCSTLALLTGCGMRGGTASEAFSVSVAPGIAGERNTIVIHDSDENAATIGAEINMADMPMPKRLTLQQSSAGSYKVDAVEFSMNGDWIIVVHDRAEHRAMLHVR